MTEQLTAIQAVTEVMRAVSHVGKSERNSQHNYNFRGIDAVVNAVGPALRDHGVIVTPLVESYDYATVEVGGNRTKMASVRVTVRYRFYGPGGDYFDAVAAGEAFDAGDKATAKAMSVAFRTCLLQTLALPTDEPDPDHDTYERAPERATDLEWVDSLRTRLAACGSPAEARGLYAEMVQVFNAGHLTAADREALEAEISERGKELTAGVPA